jgi:quinol monooxygenase YgiN
VEARDEYATGGDVTPARVDLHLRLRVKPGQRDAFLAFLREATPFCESPGGIEVRLLQDVHDDHRFIELVLYDDEAAYLRDQQRVEHDPTMKAHLARWRALLAEPPTVEVYRLTAFT